MANSKIKIYRTNITPERNALDENIERYLGSLTPTYNNDNFQYLKLGLDLDIKIVMPQNVISNQSLGNYVRIEQDNKIWYYFITKYDWKGVDTVEVSISIDSINTFADDFELSDRTVIQRQHGDRFYATTGTNTLVRRIDPESEQMVSEKINTATDKILQAGRDFDWYLMYRTRQILNPNDMSNPIDCFLFASEQVPIKTPGQSSVTFGIPDFVRGDYYYFTSLDNPEGQFKIGDTTYTLNQPVYVNNGVLWQTSSPGFVNQYDTVGKLKMIMVHTRPTVATLFVNFYLLGDGDTDQPFIYSIQVDDVKTTRRFTTGPDYELTPTTITFLQGAYFRHSTHEEGNYFLKGEYAVYDLVHDKMNINAGTDSKYINSIDQIDKTDSRIVKIIKLPYCPVEIQVIDGNYYFPNEWVFQSGLMKLKDEKLSTQFEGQIGNVSLPELFLSVPPVKRSVLTNKDIANESKLYHSEFYTKKLVYDSFTKDIPLEQIDMSGKTFVNPAVAEIPLYFKQTNTINSKFAFKIDYDAIKENYGTYKPQGDYDNYILVSRNNEETIFSNDFINYIRNGYNYDKKLNENNLNSAWAQWGLNAGISSVLTAASAAHPAVGVSAAVSKIMLQAQYINYLGKTFAGALNPIYLEKNQNLAMQAKLNQLAAQSSSVTGSDDIDLLTYYNGNRLTVFQYETKEWQKNLAFNNFYRYGYTHNAVELPNTSSRYWFNYIQCNPVFKEENSNPYNNFLNDIKARYQQGVTVYHQHNGVGAEYDWNQEYENWETFLAVPPTPDITILEGTTTYQIGFKAVEPLGEWADNGTTIYYELEITDENDNTSQERTTTANQRNVIVQKSYYQGIKQVKIREVNGAETTAWYTQTF